MSKQDKNIESIYPLSPMQQGLLFHTLLAPKSGVYFEQILYTLTGNLQEAAFRLAWQQAVDRHEVLRTLFVWEGQKKPLQVVRRRVALPWEQLDWRGLSGDEQTVKLAAFLQTDRQRGCDLTQAPLMRLALIRMDETGYELIWSHHHLLMDGWSSFLILKDVMAIYQALKEGRNCRLGPLRPYRDFVDWLQKYEQSKAESYWLAALKGFTVPTPLLGSKAEAGHAGGDYVAAQQLFHFSSSLMDAMKLFAKRHDLTLSTLVHAAWAMMLSRYSGEHDIVFGSTGSGRSAELEGIDSMVGLFLNTLPVRAQFSPQDSVLAWLRDFQSHLAELRQYEHSPLVDVQGWSEVDREHPLFESIMVFENYAVDTAALEQDGTLQISNVRVLGPTNYPLTAIFVPGKDLYVRVSYDSRRFDAAAISQMLGHLNALLEGILSNPDQQLSDLSMLSEGERHQLLVEWNATASDYPENRCVHELVEEQAKHAPEAVAAVFESTQLTYRQLNDRANQLAHHLQKLGVGPDTLVGICLERSLEVVVCLLGILKAGGAYLPLDPGYPKERLAFMVHDSGAAVLLTHQGLRDQLQVENPNCQILCLDADWGTIARSPTRNPISGVSPENLAYVIYTSGSTGRPKGVEIEHRALTNFLCSMAQEPGLSETGVLLAVTTLAFDIAGLELFLPLITGARIELASREMAQDGAALARTLSSSGATTMQATPATWRLLFESGWKGDRRLRALCGGEAMDRDLAARLVFTCGSVWNMYGPTETTIWSSVARIESDEVTIGRPIANTQMYVLDGNREPVPPGVTGELHIGGVQLARGYLGRPELTAEKFVQNPFGEGRLYKTGDLARYRSDGAIECLGRIDSQVKIRGFRIELGEIETVLRQHPSVQEGVVIAREDIPGNKRLVAYVVARDHTPGDERLTRHAVRRNGAASPSELREFLKVKLPEYMVPAHFVFLEKLPLTPNRKIDRKVLPAPQEGELCLEQYVAPRDPTEEILAGIWAEVLGRERVGIHENFFDLGGHSLLATQVVSRVREAFDRRIEVPVRALFEAPTVASLGARLTEAGQGENVPPPMRAVSREEPLALSFAQQRLWFLDRLEEGQSVAYQVPGAIRLEGALRVDALERAFSEIVRRHEVLRTIFGPGEEGPLQLIVPETQTGLSLLDLIDCPEGEHEAELRRRLREEVYKPFDLARGPLLRTRLYRLGEQEHVLFLNMHHIVSDGWSIRVLFRELGMLYAAFCQGQPSPLPELAIQYADYAHWQRDWLHGAALERQLKYWKERLAGAPALLELPTDRPRPPVQTFRGGKVAFTIPKAVAVGLKGVGRGAGATPFMTLYGAFAVLLSRWSGQEDLVIGSPIAGRRHAALEPLIGFLVNTLALRADLSGDPSFWELLGRIKTMTLEAFAHQDLPFEQLVEELQPVRSLSYTPLFQAMLVLQNAPVEAIDLGELKATPVESGYEVAKFDLMLGLQEAEEGLRGNFNYNADLFDEETIGSMADQFQMLREGIVAEPEGRISELPLLRAAERHRIVVEWNATATEYPKNKCIHELFEEQVERTPDAVAVVFEEEQLSYRELNERANRLAHYLRGLGVGPEKLVGLCLERSVEMIVGLLGILKAGGAYVPLDAEYPKDRLAYMLENAGISVLLMHEATRARLPDVGAQTVNLDAAQEAIGREPEYNLVVEMRPSASAYLLYTSGSTGRPKGVLMEHGPLVNLIWWQCAASVVGVRDRTLQFAPLSFDVSFQECFSTWCSGGTLVLIGETLRHDFAALLSWLRDARIQRLFLPFVALQHLAMEGMRDESSTWTLREVITAGEQLRTTAEIRTYFQRLVGCRLVNQYGPTEAHVVSAHTLSGLAEAWAALPPIGVPIANTRLYILDRRGQPLPVGVPGELHIGGTSLARGYLNYPELTAEKFVPDPFSDLPGARLYKTGDLCRWLSNGHIEYLGRIDHQVKIRGFRIELGEIETVLRQHPSVQESIVIAREDIPGDKRLVAYIVARDHTPGDERLTRHAISRNGAASPSELREFLKVKLPEYMVPAAFVRLQALPLTPNGKVDRKALPKPDFEAVADECKFVAASTPTEIVLARIWCKVLGLKQVGIHDNFFELGGHSLLALRIFSEIEKMFGDRPPLATLFQAPTIEKLATVLDDRSWKANAALSPLVAIQPSGLRPPFFGVHGGYGDVMFYSELARRLGKDQPFYALQAAGLKLNLMKYASIEAIASYYLQEIRQVQAHGPYFLGGYCLGGVIALETAQQLRAAGEEVALLVLFDTNNPARPTQLSTVGKRIRLALDESSSLPPSEKLRYIARRIAARLKRDALKVQKARYEFLELLHKTRKPDGENTDGGLLPLELPVWITLKRATAKYKPRAYPGRIVLFRAIVPDGHEFFDDRGWTEVAEGGLEIHDTPAKHGTMFDQRHAAVGAEKLAACIQAELSR